MEKYSRLCRKSCSTFSCSKMFAKCTCNFTSNKTKVLTVACLCIVTIHLIFNYGSSNYADEVAPTDERLHQPPFCPLNPHNLTNETSAFTPDLEKEPLDAVEERFKDLLDIGGFYTPTKCRARYRVCMIIPTRDREEHLPIFLKNIHSFLMKQNIEYKIIVVEQTAGRLFNKGALYNVAFIKAIETESYDYFVFHDIDLIPVDNRNIYVCSEENPRHLTVAIDILDFRLPYKELIGGGIVFTTEQFKRINGYSNLFWGWGGEDDDLFYRVTNCSYTIQRYPVNIAKYVSLPHNQSFIGPNRFKNLYDGDHHFKNSGLHSVNYSIVKFEKKRTHTWILVDVLDNSQQR